MLGQRRRRWPNIKPALVKRVVIAGQYNPEYIKHWTNSDRMLGQCLRCWPIIELILCDRVVLTVSLSICWSTSYYGQSFRNPNYYNLGKMLLQFWARVENIKFCLMSEKILVLRLRQASVMTHAKYIVKCTGIFNLLYYLLQNILKLFAHLVSDILIISIHIAVAIHVLMWIEMTNECSRAERVNTDEDGDNGSNNEKSALSASLMLRSRTRQVDRQEWWQQEMWAAWQWWGSAYPMGGGGGHIWLLYNFMSENWHIHYKYCSNLC